MWIELFPLTLSPRVVDLELELDVRSASVCFRIYGVGIGEIKERRYRCPYILQRKEITLLHERHWREKQAKQIMNHNIS